MGGGVGSESVAATVAVGDNGKQRACSASDVDEGLLDHCPLEPMYRALRDQMTRQAHDITGVGNKARETEARVSTLEASLKSYEMRGAEQYRLLAEQVSGVRSEVERAIKSWDAALEVEQGKTDRILAAVTSHSVESVQRWEKIMTVLFKILGVASVGATSVAGILAIIKAVTAHSAGAGA